MSLNKGIAFEAVHDDVVVPPGALQTGQGKRYAVRSPKFRAWAAHIHAHPELLQEVKKLEKNPPAAKGKFVELFKGEALIAPANKQLWPGASIRRFRVSSFF